MLQWALLGRWLILIGLTLVALGVLVLVLSKIPFLNRLDIRYQSDDGRFNCWFPLLGSLLLSLLLTVVLNLALRLLKR